MTLTGIFDGGRGDLMATVSERVKGVETRVDNLEEWQKRQNGTIRDVRNLVVKMIWLQFAGFTSLIGVAFYLGRCVK
jgi:hypothetical protein